MLLQWRNDLSTREASHSTALIDKNEHVQWLKRTLENENRKLYIAEVDGVPIGTVRADYENPGYELSWTVSPQKRGLGLGRKMVRHLAESITEPIRAEIKEGNMGSIHIAEAAGMVLVSKGNSTLHYQRNALAQPIIPPDLAHKAAQGR
jgi:RimJ/RimL family protein N-acetyltransferase